MTQQLNHSMFYNVLFPEMDGAISSAFQEDLLLQKVVRFNPAGTISINDIPIVIFDFETTGLDANDDRIIEIGALKLHGFEVVAEYSTLVKPDVPLSEVSKAISGITEEMLEGQPGIDQVLPGLLDFIEGSILVAHNADFDMSFLKAASSRLGYQLSWPCFCTLKLARALLPQLESKSLDALATHYGLSFEARHRSIGDAKVTAAVLGQLLRNEGHDLREWQNFQNYIAN